jgi:hypothetical protein
VPLSVEPSLMSRVPGRVQQADQRHLGCAACACRPQVSNKTVTSANQPMSTRPSNRSRV